MSEQETMIMVMKVVSSDDRWQKWGWVPIKSFTLSGDQKSCRRLEWGLWWELSCQALKDNDGDKDKSYTYGYGDDDDAYNDGYGPYPIT